MSLTQVDPMTEIKETTDGLDYEFAARLTALVTEFKERGLDPEAISALMEHVSETHGAHDD